MKFNQTQSDIEVQSDGSEIWTCGNQESII